MAIVINGFQVDDTADWWGFTRSSSGATGFVDPSARADFFEEIRLANVNGGRNQTYTHPLTGDHVFRTKGTTWVYDSVTGLITVGHSIPNWRYSSGDDPRIALYICCASVGRASIPVAPTVEAPIAVAGQTQDWSRTLDGSFGTWDHAMGGGHSDSTPAWDFTNSYAWGAIGVAVKGA